MKSLGEKLEVLRQEALNKIKRKVIAYNKKKGNKRYFDLPLMLSDEVQFNVSSTYIVSVSFVDSGVKYIRFNAKNGHDYDLPTEKIIEIADSL